MPPLSKMSHMIFSCPSRHPPNHTSSCNAISTSTTMNDTSETSHSTSFQEGSTRHPTSTREQTHVVALPAKNLLEWSPRALHIPLHGHYGTLCFMWRHIKTCWSWPCFHRSMGHFFPIWHDGFKVTSWRRTTMPKWTHIAAKKTTFSYSVSWCGYSLPGRWWRRVIVAWTSGRDLLWRRGSV